MKNKYIFLSILLLAAGFSACEKECDGTHLGGLEGYPTVMKGSFPTEDVAAEIGKKIEIAPQLLDTADARYTWTLDGEFYSDSVAFAYTPDKPYRGTLVCSIKNKVGTVEMKTRITTDHDFSKGFFVVTTQTVGFYDTDKKTFYEDCYGSLNGGKSFGESRVAASVVSDGKLYIALNGNVTNADKFFALEAPTLYYENSREAQTHMTGFMPLNKDYGVVCSSEGIFRIDLMSLSVKQIVKNKRYLYPSNGIVYNGRLLLNVTYEDEMKVLSYSVDELLAATGTQEQPEARELEIVQNQKINFVLGKDGCVYTLGYADGQSQLIKIKSDFSAEAVPLAFEPARNPYWGDPTVCMAAAGDENAVYVASADNAVYKYVFGDASSLNQPFIAAGDMAVCGGVRLNSVTGELYVLYGEDEGWHDYVGSVGVYSAKDGSRIAEVDCGGDLPVNVLF